MYLNLLKSALRKWVCNLHSELLRWVFIIIKRVPDDQDSCSTAFKWLNNRCESELTLFQFNPGDKVDYQYHFVWFNDHENSIDVVKQDNLNGRPYDPYLDLNMVNYEDILKRITIDVIKKYPDHVIGTLLFIKPAKLFYNYDQIIF